ncbi:MAG: hypothetical protein ABI779_03065 [Acidobacteriota bacterium]
MASAVDPSVVAREPRLLPGFTAIGIIVLAAIAYSIRVSINPAAGQDLLTFTFIVANVVGWLLGAILRNRHPKSTLGFLLVLLGDAIFPLNLYAPLLLYIPITHGNVPNTATGVILVGLTYHLWNYWNRSTARFALPFYSYFFALAGVAGIVLTQFTVGLPMWTVAWLVLLYGLAFNEMSFRLRPEPAVHFAIAAATIMTASLVVSALAYRDRQPIALAALIGGTFILIFSAIRERADEAMSRAHGMAAWLGVTFTFTALLYAFHSPLWVYLVATGAWTLVLAIVSTRQGHGWSEPFPESAWWTAMVLAAALAGVLWHVWLPFVMRTMSGRPLAEATTVALLQAGLALAIVSSWRRRYPQIAATMEGFVANNVLLRLTSYTAPLLLIIAVAGTWTVLHAPSPANVYATLTAGTLLLIFGPALTRHYPTEALDFAGVLAMVFSAFNALESAWLSAMVLFGAAAILLVRRLRGATWWTFVAFLALTAGGLALQPIGSARATVVCLAATVVVAWASGREAKALARTGFWSAQAAGLLFWFSLAALLSLGRSWDAVVLATWAWVAFIASRLMRGVGASTSLHACLALVAASAVMLLTRPAGAPVLLIALLILAALLLELRHLHYAGFALLAVAIVEASTVGESTWLILVLAFCAAVLLWRSLASGSSFAHLLFIATAGACAYLSMPGRGPLQAMPIALLVILLCVVELVSTRISKRSAFHADVTSVVSLLLVIAIVTAEVVSVRFSLVVLGTLLVAVFAIRYWIVAAEHHRVQPLAHALTRAFGMIIGAIALVALGRQAGLSASQQVFTLSVTAWMLLPLLLRTPRRTVASWAVAVALHILALGVYAAAFFVRGDDPFLFAACLVASGAYLVWRSAWNVAALEHFAAAGVVSAICLWGWAQGIAWPEYYIFTVCAYLSVVLLRRTAPRIENAIALVVIAAAVAYPYYALLRTTQREHLAFLAGASVVIIHVLLQSRRHAVMVVTVCAMLGLGMLFGAVVHDDVRLNLLMALVGFVVIADLGLIGIRSDRRTRVGEIEYDHNRVTR